ncbi:MAG: V-type ATPase subunit [Gammaproteobacteria bacterium]|nr:V-type ATPase subunit [Gammaproteobacteria bacterium]
MNICGSQVYLKTRIRILSNQLLTEQEVPNLLQVPLTDLSDRLSLGSILEETADPHYAGTKLERSMIRLLMLEFGIILYPLAGKARELLLYWSRKFELYNLKTLIRGKLNGLSLETIRDDLHELPDNIRLPHETLLHAENVLEMLRLLERGAYATIARQARQVYEEKNESFSLDAAIDRLYYSGLARYVQTTEVTDQQGLKHLVSTLIDRQNILWLLRYRFAYDFAPSKAYYLLIPNGGYLTRQRLMALSNLQSFDDLLAKLPLRYANLLRGSTNSMQIRQRLDMHVSEQARRLIRFSPCVVVAALGYMVAREKDLRRLFAILQGRLLELDQAIIEEAVASWAEPEVMERAS